MDTKHLTGVLTIKNAERGEVEAEVAAIGVPDLDGDVLLPGSIRPGNRVALSGYGHSVVLEGAAPVGIGSMTERGEMAVFDGRVFLNTAAGREALELIKALGPDARWSFGFPHATVKTAPLTDEWRERGAKRLLAEVEPVEASPVFRPAQPLTRTVSLKAGDDAAEQAELRAIHEKLIAGEARDTLTRADRLLSELDRAMSRGPSREHESAAGFAAAVAAKLLHGDEPRIYWLKMVDARGRFDHDQPDRIYLAPDLSIAETVETTLHETQHAIAAAPWLTKADSERFANEFARTWTLAVLRAGDAAEWDLERVRVVDRERPAHLLRHERERLGLRRGDVALARKSATAWKWAGSTAWDNDWLPL